MARIVGIDLQENKLVWIALTSLYGVGRKNVRKILQKAQVSLNKRVSELTSEEVTRITKTLDGYTIEGDLRREVSENIKRLKEIGSYRGLRHIRNLPARGQRTRSNARTKRGKRVTIGALKKEAMAKTEPAQEQKAPVAKEKQA